MKLDAVAALSRQARPSRLTQARGHSLAVANPTLARILSNTALPEIRDGISYHIVQKEPGAVKRDIPIFAMSENHTVQRCSSDTSEQDAMIGDDDICGNDVDGVPGAVLISNVLSPTECDQLIKLTESAGYDQDAPTRLGRHVRQNENCVLVANEAFNDIIFERCRGKLPAMSCGGELCGINRRWRFYKYHCGDIFRAHIDPGGWTGSGFDKNGGLIGDCFGDRVSQMTFLLYLNDEFDGGETRFFVNPVRPCLGDAGQCSQIVSVSPSQGTALCFFHGNHALSPWHEGGKLTAGTKYVLRSDVLYKFR